MSDEKQLDIEALLSLLDLEEPEQFEYFEHLADLLEAEQRVEPEAYYTLFSAVPENTVRELLTNYFSDIMGSVPDVTVELYTLLDSIRASLIGLTHGLSEPDTLRKFADELMKFHNWYALDSEVNCKRLTDGELFRCSVCEALALYRLEKLNEDEYDYDFDSCLDYDLDEYSISLNDMMASEWTDDDNHGDHCSCGDDHCGGDDSAPAFDAFSDGLVDPDNPVIDGDYEDDAEY